MTMEPDDLDSVEHRLHRLGTLDRVGLAGVASSEPARLLCDAIVAQPFAQPARSGGRRRRGRRTVLLAAAILVGSLGFIASAADRWLSPADQPDLIDNLIVDIPLPPGGTWDRQREAIASQQATMEGLPSLASGLAFGAACQWYGYWMEGELAGNESQVSDAIVTIQQIPDWPQFDYPGVRSTARHFERLRTSVLAGDTAAISDWLTANCDPEIYGRG
jgi:hypothetical protein